MSGSDNKKYSIKFISEYINASIVGDDGLEIDNIATLDNAVQGCVTFLSNSKYKKLLDIKKPSIEGFFISNSFLYFEFDKKVTQPWTALSSVAILSISKPSSPTIEALIYSEMNFIEYFLLSDPDTS